MEGTYLIMKHDFLSEKSTLISRKAVGDTAKAAALAGVKLVVFYKWMVAKSFWPTVDARNYKALRQVIEQREAMLAAITQGDNSTANIENYKHTPGPWKSTFDSAKRRAIRGAKGFICFIPKPTHFHGQDERYEEELEEDRANAALIAAAPDLLNALKLILADPHGCRFCDSGKLRNPSKEHDNDCGYFAAERVFSEKYRTA